MKKKRRFLIDLTKKSYVISDYKNKFTEREIETITI